MAQQELLHPMFYKTHTTTGTGNRSLPCSYRFLNHRNVAFICICNDLVLTASCATTYPHKESGEIKVWSDDGRLLQTVELKHAVNSMIYCWKDIIATTFQSDYSIVLWKLKKSKQKVNLKLRNKIFSSDSKSTMTPILVWDDVLLVKNNDISKCELYFCNKDGKLNPAVTEDFISTNFSHVDCKNTLVVQGYLWTIHSDQVFIWEKKDNKIQRINKIQRRYRIFEMCIWGNLRIACPYYTHIEILSLDGTLLFTIKKIDRQVMRTTTWRDKLVCVNEFSQVNGKPPLMLIWNWDGTLMQVFDLEGQRVPRSLLVIKNRLWQGSDSYVRIWDFPGNWKTEKLLWVGWMKHKAPECWLASLPKELILYIMSYL